MKLDQEKLRLTESPGALECPQCGKRVLVEYETNKYRCLWCGFSRVLSDSESDDALPLLAVLALIVFILLL